MSDSPPPGASPSDTSFPKAPREQPSSSPVRSDGQPPTVRPNPRLFSSPQLNRLPVSTLSTRRASPSDGARHPSTHGADLQSKQRRSPSVSAILTPKDTSTEKRAPRPASVHRMTLRSHMGLQVVCANTPSTTNTTAVTSAALDNTVRVFGDTPKRFVKRAQPRTLFSSHDENVRPNDENALDAPIPRGVAALRARFESFRQDEPEFDVPIQEEQSKVISNSQPITTHSTVSKDMQEDLAARSNNKTNEEATKSNPQCSTDPIETLQNKVDDGNKSPRSEMCLGAETKNQEKDMEGGNSSTIDLKNGNCVIPAKPTAVKEQASSSSAPIPTKERRSRSCDESILSRGSVSRGIKLFQNGNNIEREPMSFDLPAWNNSSRHKLMRSSEFLEAFGSGGIVKRRPVKVADKADDVLEKKDPVLTPGLRFGQPTAIKYSSGRAIVYDTSSTPKTLMSENKTFCLHPKENAIPMVEKCFDLGEKSSESVREQMGEGNHLVTKEQSAVRELLDTKKAEIREQVLEPRKSLNSEPKEIPMMMKVPSSLISADSRVSSMINQLKEQLGKNKMMRVRSPKALHFGKANTAARPLQTLPIDELDAARIQAQPLGEEQMGVDTSAAENSVAKLKQKFQSLGLKSTKTISSPKPISRSAISALKKRISGECFDEVEEEFNDEAQKTSIVKPSSRASLASFSEDEEDEYEDEQMEVDQPAQNARAHCRTDETQLEGYIILQNLRESHRNKRAETMTKIRERMQKINHEIIAISPITERSEISLATAVSPTTVSLATAVSSTTVSSSYISTAVSPTTQHNSSVTLDSTMLSSSSSLLEYVSQSTDQATTRTPTSLSFGEFLAISPNFASPFSISSTFKMGRLMARNQPPSASEERRRKRQELILLLNEDLTSEKREEVLKELEFLVFDDFDDDLKIMKGDALRLLVLLTIEMQCADGNDPDFDPLETALLTAILNVDSIIERRLAGEMGPGGHILPDNNNGIPTKNMEVITSGFDLYLEDYNDNLNVCLEILSVRLSRAQSLSQQNVTSSDVQLEAADRSSRPSTEPLSVTGSEGSEESDGYMDEQHMDLMSPRAVSTSSETMEHSRLEITKQSPQTVSTAIATDEKSFDADDTDRSAFNQSSGLFGINILEECANSPSVTNRDGTMSNAPMSACISATASNSVEQERIQSTEYVQSAETHGFCKADENADFRDQSLSADDVSTDNANYDKVTADRRMSESPPPGASPSDHTSFLKAPREQPSSSPVRSDGRPPNDEPNARLACSASPSQLNRLPVSTLSTRRASPSDGARHPSTVSHSHHPRSNQHGADLQSKQRRSPSVSAILTPKDTSTEKRAPRPASVHRMTLRSHMGLQVVCANTPSTTNTTAVTSAALDNTVRVFGDTPKRFVKRAQPRTLFSSHDENVRPNDENALDAPIPRGVAALRARFESFRQDEPEFDVPIQEEQSKVISNSQPITTHSTVSKDMQEDLAARSNNKTNEEATKSNPQCSTDPIETLQNKVDDGNKSPRSEMCLGAETKNQEKDMEGGNSSTIDLKNGNCVIPAKPTAVKEQASSSSAPIPTKERRSRSCDESILSRGSVSRGIKLFQNGNNIEREPMSFDLPAWNNSSRHKLMRSSEFLEAFGSGGIVKRRPVKVADKADDVLEKKDPVLTPGLRFGQPTAIKYSSGRAIVYDTSSTPKTLMSENKTFCLHPKENAIPMVEKCFDLGEKSSESVREQMGEGNHLVTKEQSAVRELLDTKKADIREQVLEPRKSLNSEPKEIPTKMKVPSSLASADSRVSSMINQLKEQLEKNKMMQVRSPKALHFGKANTAARPLQTLPIDELDAARIQAQPLGEEQMGVDTSAAESSVAKLKQKFQSLGLKSTKTLSSPKPISRSAISALKKRISGECIDEVEEEFHDEAQKTSIVKPSSRASLASFSEDEEDEYEDEQMEVDQPAQNARAHCRTDETQLEGYIILQNLRESHRNKRAETMTKIRERMQKINHEIIAISPITERSEISLATAVSPTTVSLATAVSSTTVSSSYISTAVSPTTQHNSSVTLDSTMLSSSSSLLEYVSQSTDQATTRTPTSLSFGEFLAISPNFASPFSISSTFKMGRLMARNQPPSASEERRRKRQELILLLNEDLTSEKREEVLKELEFLVFDDFDDDLKIMKGDALRLLVLLTIEMQCADGNDPDFDPLETALLTAILNVDSIIERRLAGEMGPGGHILPDNNNGIPTKNMEVITSGFDLYLEDYNDNLNVCLEILSVRLSRAQSLSQQNVTSSDVQLEAADRSSRPSTEPLSVTGSEGSEESDGYMDEQHMDLMSPRAVSTSSETMEHSRLEITKQSPQTVSTAIATDEKSFDADDTDRSAFNQSSGLFGINILEECANSPSVTNRDGTMSNAPMSACISATASNAVEHERIQSTDYVQSAETHGFCKADENADFRDQSLSANDVSTDNANYDKSD